MTNPHQQAAFAPDLLAGKTALISGGSSGIGLHIAQGFAAHGCRVAVLGRNFEKAEAAAKAIGPAAMPLSADVRDFGQLEAAVAQLRAAWGEIDIVVAGAAGNFLAEAAKMSANAFRTVVDIDLMGTFNLFRAAYGALRRPGASLIGILAGQASRALPQQAHACAAKAGVAMLLECLALEWGPEGIRVNGLTPGPIADTEGMRRLVSPERTAALADRIPLRRLGVGGDIAASALFLASGGASYVTGASITCDGGAALGAYGEP
jgi:NAD(P)-dependent dehydrogenase (short-subunit alcohol dehydrogenase family)